MLLFSTLEMKYVLYLPKKSKFSFYFIHFRTITVNETALQTLTFFLAILREFCLVQRVYWV